MTNVVTGAPVRYVMSMDSSKKLDSERIADADARGSAWLSKANDLAERGKKQQADRAYQKGQFWLDRSNRLRGNN